MHQWKDALRKLDHNIRESSKCPVCFKPRHGFRRVTGGKWINTTDETGTLSDHNTGGVAQSYKDSGLCTCDQVTFIDTHGQKPEHPAQGGVFAGFEPGINGTLSAVSVRINNDSDPIVVRASDFSERVIVDIFVPEEERHMRVLLVEIPVEAVA